MKPQVIAFHYDLKNGQGQPVESSRPGEPLISLEGAGQILPALESALSALSVGDKKEIQLKAVDAYGDHDQNLIVDIPKGELPATPEQLKVGVQFQSQSPEGHMQVFTVKKFNDTHVTLDGNHPLAGQDLVFNVEVVEKRDATEEELQHGHAHGGDGHHH